MRPTVVWRAETRPDDRRPHDLLAAGGDFRLALLEIGQRRGELRQFGRGLRGDLVSLVPCLGQISSSDAAICRSSATRDWRWDSQTSSCDLRSVFAT